MTVRFAIHLQVLLLLQHLKFHKFNFFLFLNFLFLHQVCLQLLDRVVVELDAHLCGSPLHSPRGQVQLAEQALSTHVDAIGLGKDDRLCDLLAVGLVTSAMLDLNVQVEGAFRAVKLLALLVRALVATLDVVGATSVVLFAA